MKALQRLLLLITIAALFTPAAFATRTTLTPVNPVNIFASSITANAADVTWVACDNLNGNRFVPSGRDVILVKNAHATTVKTCTITSAPDDLGRTADITYSIDAGEVVVLGPYPLKGWLQSDGYFYLTGESTDIKYAIYRMPSNR